MLAILSFILQLPIIKAGALMFGISVKPNVVFGALAVDPSSNPHPAYRTWYHLQCTNQAKSGWRGRLGRTEDARECQVSIEFRPSTGQTPSKRDAGIFTIGARSEPITTLFVGKTVVIPVYWISDSQNNIFASERGFASHPGYYMTGETFIFHRDIRKRWKLEPGVYRLIVSVIWNRESFTYETELAVPEIG